MFALEEGSRTLVILRPELLLKESEVEQNKGTGRTLVDDICARFTDRFLDVKARKSLYLPRETVESFFHYLKPAELKSALASFGRGLCEVVVLEHVLAPEDGGDAVEEVKKCFTEELCAKYGASSVYYCGTTWEAARGLEFFFPHLDLLPVERTLAIIKPDGIAKGAMGGNTLEAVAEERIAALGLHVVAMSQRCIRDKEAELLSADVENAEMRKGSKSLLMQDVGAIVMCIEGRGAIGKWLLACGPGNSGFAREIAPTTLRAAWGTDSVSNAIHASGSFEAAERELEAFFPEGSLESQTTLCIVKSSATKHFAKIRCALLDAGFVILKEVEATLTEARAKEFYADCSGEAGYNDMVQELHSGPCFVLALCRLEAIMVLQCLLGPASVPEAKSLRPTSLRARYGEREYRNSVHGSASSKVASREVRFFLSRAQCRSAPKQG
jgi:nucleoside-diphosphate kinase